MLNLRQSKLQGCLMTWLVLIIMVANVVPAFAQNAPRHSKTPTNKLSATLPAAVDDPTTLARMVPSDGFVFVELANLQIVIDTLDTIIKSEEIRNLLKDKPEFAQLQQYETFLAALGLPDKATLRDTRVAVAVRMPKPATPPKGAKRGAKSPSPEPEVVVFLEPPTVESADKIRVAFAGLVEKQGMAKPTTVMVGKTKIMAYTEKQPVAYVQMGKILAFGLLPMVKSVVSTVAPQTGAALNASTDFAMIRQRVGTPQTLFAYVNTKIIGELINTGIEAFKPPPSVKKGSKPVKKEPSAGDVALSNIGNYLGLPSLGGIGLAAGMTETEFRQRLYVAIDRKGKGLLPVLADAPDLTLRGAALAPDSAQLFVSFGFNHLRFYDEVLEAIRALPRKKDEPPPDAFIAQGEAMAGFKIRDEFLAGFSGEHGVFINVGDVSQLIKNPGSSDLPKDARLAGFMVLSNPGMVKAGIDKLLKLAAAEKKEGDTAEKKPGPTRETYKDIEIIQIEEVGISFIDDMLVIGRASDVKWVIDSRAAGQTLEKNPSFAALRQKSPQNSMLSYYISEKFQQAMLEGIRKEAAPGVLELLSQMPSMAQFIHLQHDDQGVFMDATVPADVMKRAMAAIPSVLAMQVLATARMNNSMSTRFVLHDLHTAMNLYQSGKGNGEYTDNLAVLGEAGEDGSSLLASDIVNMQKTPRFGYLLGPIKLERDADGKLTRYSVVAFPAVKDGQNRTGDDCFYVDETGVVRHSNSATVLPDKNSEPVGSK